MSVDHLTSQEPSQAMAVPAAGSCEFLTRSERSERCKQLADRGYLVARVVPIFDSESDERHSRPSGIAGPLKRDHLREALEGAVEISLALRGDLPPAVEVDADPLMAARDQLFRVRTLAAQGLCLVLPELKRLGDDQGTLSASDSESLWVWKQLAEDGPVVLLFDAGDRDLGLLAPRPLAEAFGARPLPPPQWPDDERERSSMVVQSNRLRPDDELDALDADLAGEADGAEAEAHQRWHAEQSELSSDVDDDIDDDIDDDVDDDIDDDWDERAQASSLIHDEIDDEEIDDEEPTAPLGPRAGRVMQCDPLSGLDPLEVGDEIDDEGDHEPPRYAAPPPAPHQASLFESLGATLPAALEPLTAKPPPPLPPDVVQRLTLELEAARGPKPVSQIEELYQTRYMPLLGALSAGLEDRRAEEVVARWRADFEHSYGEGFNAMKVTGRRPTMVLDAPDIAARAARLNGARAVQLLLVDAMRFDLGERVHDELQQLLADRAVCVDKTLMWAALPSITPVQMRLLSRGARGLREPDPPSEREVTIHREGSIATIRRLRIGQRDLSKLELAEARLREAGPAFGERMGSLAHEVAHVIARFSESLAPRTLLFVFGDHGFQLPITAPNATGPAEQGGASPEEVLVGGQAWLVGDVH